MMRFMFFIFFILFSIFQLSLQLSGEVCENKQTRNDECCYNYENVQDVCTECKIGTVSQPGCRCLPCKQNMYGIKCLDYCTCNHSQRCDNKIGCTEKTVTTIDTQNEEYSFTTQKFTTQHLNKDSTLDRNGSTMELTIYTLSAIGVLIIIVFSHCVRSYRKRLVINIRRDNERNEIESRQERVEQPYIGIYDEIDENLVGLDNSDQRVPPPIRNTSALITDAQREEKDNSSYLDACFAPDETETQSSFKESSSSHSSNSDLVILDNTGYLNPYQPLLESVQQIPDGYDVAIHIRQNSENSSGSMTSEDGSSVHKYSHVYQQLRQDQSAITHVYDKATKNMNEKEFIDSDENKNDSSKKKVSVDTKGTDSRDLLDEKQVDEKVSEPAFSFQTMPDDDCENSELFLNENNKGNTNRIENTDKPMNKNKNQTFYDEDSTEKVQCVENSNEYLDMQNSTNTCDT